MDMSFCLTAQASPSFGLKNIRTLKLENRYWAVVRFVPYSFLICCAVERLASLHPIVPRILVYYSRLP